MNDTAAALGAQRTKPLCLDRAGHAGHDLHLQLPQPSADVRADRVAIKNDPAFLKQLPDGTTVGLTDAEMGWMTGFWFALVSLFLGVVVGFLADRTSHRNILFVGATPTGRASPPCAACRRTTALFSRVGVGVGEAAAAPPSYSIISDYFPAEKRGIALALFSHRACRSARLAPSPFGPGQAVEAYGWRAAFIAIGVAGVIAALLMVFVVREPKRGAHGPGRSSRPWLASAPASAPPSGSSSAARPCWTAIGCGLSAFVGYAALGWNASFLLRTLHMTPAEPVALVLALVIGVGLGIGTVASGFIVDLMAKRSKVWYALTPLIAMTAATPFWYLYTQATDWPTGLWLLILPLLLNIFYLAPALAMVNNSVKPSQRTMSSAILLMVLNFIGLGGGPTLVGILSTNFSANKVAAGMDKALAGAEGLRDALLWMTPFFGVAVFFMVLQAIAIHRESEVELTGARTAASAPASCSC